jgi:hypothetical protein
VKVQVYNLKGQATKQIDVRDDVFAVPFNESVVHQALVRQLADKRLGNADTKRRGEVAGSGKKLHNQKPGELAAATPGHLCLKAEAWPSAHIPGATVRQCPKKCVAWL